MVTANQNASHRPVIVFVQTAFLGDVLLSIPTLKWIRKIWPGHQLALVCRKGVGSFFSDAGLVDQIFEIEKGNKKAYREVAFKLNQSEITKVICPHQSVRSALFCFSLKAKSKIAFAKAWNWIFFSETVFYSAKDPEAIRQLRLLVPDSKELRNHLRQWQSPTLPVNSSKLPAVPEWASMKLVSVVKLDSKKVAIFPGSVWATKKWTEEGFVSLAKSLAVDHQVIWMGSADEKEICERLAGQTPGSESKAGQFSLFETYQQLQSCSMVICNDSGGQHLAAAAGVPTVSIFGPTILDFGYRPWGNQTAVAQIGKLACRPCGKHGHQKCPTGTHECMKNLRSDSVVSLVRDLER